MSATVVSIRPGNEVLLTKKQLATHLDRSTRWVELRMREGLPSIAPTERYPHRRFRLGDVEAWLAGGKTKTAGHAERIARLEEQVARLTATVERLQRSAG